MRTDIILIDTDIVYANPMYTVPCINFSQCRNFMERNLDKVNMYKCYTCKATLAKKRSKLYRKLSTALNLRKNR